MSRRLNRLWLLPVVLLASQSWALGLGDIRLSSALNEPLRAEIDLLAATLEELENLTVQLSSLETFERYDLDRPLFLSRMRFRLVRSGGVEGNIIRITSSEPITEPFITFLVEAVWSRGRLLREYTLLLDPPTFAPPPATQATQAVTAPTRAAQTDSGQIQRPAPQPSAPAPVPAPVSEPVGQQAPAQATEAEAEPAPFAAEDQPLPEFEEPAFDTTAPGDYVIQRGDTLWGITSRARADSRLTMNQMMLAIFEANPQAFSSNINVMSAGASLRIPSADEVFRISRGDALDEVRRQNAAWGGGIADVDTQPQPALTLVPPDDDVSLFDDDAGQTVVDDAVADLIDADDARINEIEGVLADHQDSLIEISDNELTALRIELAELRGEEPPQPLPVVDDPFIDDADDALADDALLDDDVEAVDVDDDVVEDTTPAVADTAAPVVQAPDIQTPRTVSLIDRILGYLDSAWGMINSIWGIIGGALIVAVALLVWFARRAGRGDDEDSTGVWESLQQDDIDGDSLASTERLRALAKEDDSAIAVVEQQSALAPDAEPESTMEPYEATVVEQEPDLAPDFTMPEESEPEVDMLADTHEATVVEDEDEPVAEPLFAGSEAEAEAEAPDTEDSVVDIEHDESLDDTFHGETGINLDQADPAAEADFHMAYGLYDQAADLINGALEAEPENEDLLAKLCEIYFVWGNRDAFVDAAGRLRAVVSDDANPEWDKIVIMGQQIAADHEMFSGVSAGAATKEVDLAFDGGMEEAGELDMDFEISEADHATSGVIDLDLGVESGQVAVPDATAEIDFDMSEEEVDIEASMTTEMPGFSVDSPTVAESLSDETSELPVGDGESDTPTIEQQFSTLDATGAMPSISELGSDDATEITNLDDFDQADDARAGDATAEIDLDDLGLDLAGLEESRIAAPEDDLEDQISDFDDTAESPTINEEHAATTELPDVDDLTDKNLAISDEDTDVGIDTRLLDSTGQTQVLSEDAAVDTASNVGASLSDDDQTMLANSDDDADTMLGPLSDDESTVLTPDIDFDDVGGTGALPKDAFTGNAPLDDTGEMPSLAGSTDLDLDLDDLTAALDVSQVGDAVDQVGGDETAEMPVGQGDADNARTMTEVGTKLDLARAYVDMGDPGGARSILEEVLEEGDESQRQQAQQILESIPS